MEEFVGAVGALVRRRVEGMVADVGLTGLPPEAFLGKLIRSRLGARLLQGEGVRCTRDEALAVCAASEILHTATLCHDDVIDASATRRHQPALWKATSVAGAILVGDVLIAEALAVLAESPAARHLPTFVARIREVGVTEAQMQFRLSGLAMDFTTWRRVCRGKTGPLFAFVSSTFGGDDGAARAALEEAGYRLGTAYQMLDDTLDRFGDEGRAGKPLRVDGTQGVRTPPSEGASFAKLAAEVGAQWDEAVAVLAAWPGLQAATEGFVQGEMKPLLRGCGANA